MALKLILEPKFHKLRMVPSERTQDCVARAEHIRDQLEDHSDAKVTQLHTVF